LNEAAVNGNIFSVFTNERVGPTGRLKMTGVRVGKINRELSPLLSNHLPFPIEHVAIIQECL
jgi:hypothetical protein